MLLLRRHEKDFLARLDLKYEKKFVDDHAKLMATIEKLSSDLHENDIQGDQSKQLETILNRYKADFTKLVAIQKKIGLNEKDGLYGSLRTAVHNVEGELKSLNDYKLTSMMLMLRRNEKDFMLRDNLKYQDKLAGNLAKLQSAVTQSNYSEATKNKIQGQLDKYSHDFNALVSGYVEKGLSSKEGMLGTMRNTVHQTETLLADMSQSIEVITEERISNIKLTVTIFSIAIIAISLGLILTVARSVIRPIRHMMETMEQIRSENNLTLQVDTSGKDEVAAMGQDLNLLLDGFKGVIQEILSSTAQVSAAAEELSSITDEANHRMQQQVSDTDMVATAIEEMSASFQEVASRTNETAQTTEQADESASRGSRIVNETVGSINTLATEISHANEVIVKLEQQSQNIGSVLDVIRGIAEQTNLLALNAAIEAARAGEQGRGFAVVADEVRTLASRTQQSTQEIQEMIESLQTGAQEAVAAMETGRSGAEAGVTRANEANVALGEITSAIRNIHDMTTHIASATLEQGQVAGEVAQSIGQIKHSVDDTGEAVSQISDASGDLAELSTRLHGMVSHYRV
jgi:methyl-accepting chemotaxis protein